MKAKIILSIIFCLVIVPSFCSAANESPDLEKGIKLFKAKQYAEAKAVFENLAKIHQRNATISYYLGMSYIAMRENKKAINSLEEATNLDGKQVDYHYALGIAYNCHLHEVGIFKKFGVGKKCKKAFMKAVELDEKHMEARINLIIGYIDVPAIAGGSLEKAEKHIQILKRQYPDMTFSVEGQLAAKKKNYKEADRLYRQAVKNNRNPSNVFELALWLLHCKQLDEANPLFNEYLTMDLSWSDIGNPDVDYGLKLLEEELKEREKKKK
ncbi:MAG: tetratricopeptide repeat protein [Desulfobacteraceae bacterium]|jgi:tetratricopeptide (TPR) repeat protein